MNFLCITAYEQSNLRPPDTRIQAFQQATNRVTPLWEISISGTVMSVNVGHSPPPRQFPPWWTLGHFPPWGRTFLPPYVDECLTKDTDTEYR